LKDELDSFVVLTKDYGLGRDGKRQGMSIHRHLAASFFGLSLGAISLPASAADEEMGAIQTAALDLKKLSIEELLDLEVTSVSKHAERLADAPPWNAASRILFFASKASDYVTGLD